MTGTLKPAPEIPVYLMGASDAEAADYTEGLASFGFQIQSFQDADRLLSAIAEHVPQALLIDCDAQDGRLSETLLQNLAESDAISCPIILISSQDGFDERLAAVRAGVEGYFIKPLNLGALADRLDDHIKQREIRAYRILAVDDDALLANFHEAILNLAGMHVKTLNDPATILEELQKFQPDLILMDMYMPTCTGIEVAKLIRLNNVHMEIPIIFLSSEEDIDRQTNALEVGADSFVSKPIDPTNFISLVSSRAQRYRSLHKNGGA